MNPARAVNPRVLRPAPPPFEHATNYGDGPSEPPLPEDDVEESLSSELPSLSDPSLPESLPALDLSAASVSSVGGSVFAATGAAAADFFASEDDFRVAGIRSSSSSSSSAIAARETFNTAGASAGGSPAAAGAGVAVSSAIEVVGGACECVSSSMTPRAFSSLPVSFREIARGGPQHGLQYRARGPRGSRYTNAGWRAQLGGGEAHGLNFNLIYFVGQLIHR